MKSIQNPWDTLSKITFNTQFEKGKIDPRVADNILIAWPSILKAIFQEFKTAKNIRVLDFGCGTGGFCNKLNQLGFEVIGIDPAVGMIDIARQHSSKGIKYVLGDQAKVATLGSFDIIVSIMTFPFICDIKDTLRVLTKSLKKNGLLTMAVFNPEWVKACLQTKISFADFNSNENPENGWKIFGDLRIPVYIRGVKEYDNISARHRLKKIYEDYPRFTQKFITKYPDNRPKQMPEYMILGYKKYG